MLYSFPKSSRFPKDKENRCDKFYEIDRKGPMRATNLGYGTKYDFTKEYFYIDLALLKLPPLVHTKLWEFLRNPEKKEKVSVSEADGTKWKPQALLERILTLVLGLMKQKVIGTQPSTASRGKEKSTTENKHTSLVQEHVSLSNSDETISTFNSTGRLFFSKYKNRSATHFGREEKLRYKDTKVPGPGAYDCSKTEFSPDGRYFYSRLQSAKNSKFGKEPRLGKPARCQSNSTFIQPLALETTDFLVSSATM